MKKGLSTQIFIFIFALIMIVLVLGFGIKSLNTVKNTADKVELLTFVTNLDEGIQEYYAFDVGSNKRVQLLLPKQIEEVCFANPEEPLTTTHPNQELLFFLKTNKKDNLYTLPLDAFTNPAPDFIIENMIVPADKNPLCVKTQGRLDILIETVLYNDQVFVQVQQP